MKQPYQSQPQTQVHDINQGIDFSNYPSNNMHPNEHFISQQTQQEQSFPYKNPKLLKHISPSINTNPNTYNNNTYIYQKQFKQNNDNALQYLNMSSQHNKSLIDSMNSMNKINALLGEHLIKRIHDDNAILTQTYNNNSYTHHQVGTFNHKGFYHQNDVPIPLFANNNGHNRNVKGLRKNIINYTFEEVHNKEYEDMRSIQTTNSSSNDNNNYYYNVNNETVTQVDSKRQSYQPTSQRVFNSKEEYHEFLKEENSNLKYTNFVYKQLLDNVMFFINSLSQKYSFNQTIYPITYYCEHVDELTRCLLELDKCISSNKQNEFKTFEIVNECELTVVSGGDVPMHLMQEQNNKNDKQRLISNLNHSKCSMNTNRSLSNINRNNSNKTISKLRLSERKDCIACLLGAGASKRGYSPMMFNSYKKYSINKIKSRDNNTISVNRFNTTSN